MVFVISNKSNRMFGFIKNSLKSIYQSLTSKLGGLFSRASIDQATLDELKLILLSADVGIKTTTKIESSLNQQYRAGTLNKGADLKQALARELSSIAKNVDNATLDQAQIILMVGINGSGKTTFSAKLADYYAKQGKRVALVAADTFRAAAVEQLTSWAQTTNIPVIAGSPSQDPASVVYAGCQAFKTNGYDRLIIDTAGRLQTKINLMKELEKVRSVIGKQLPEARICTLLTIDSMLGQNSFEQARLFDQATSVDGIVLTKMDGTGKGGIIFAIGDELGLPVAYISYGESLGQFKRFEPESFISELING